MFHSRRSRRNRAVKKGEGGETRKIVIIVIRPRKICLFRERERGYCRPSSYGGIPAVVMAIIIINNTAGQSCSSFIWKSVRAAHSNDDDRVFFSK